MCSKRKCKTKLPNQVLALSTFLGCKLLRLSPFSLFWCTFCFKQLRAMPACHRDWAGLAADLLHQHDLELLQLGSESMKPPTPPPPCNPHHPCLPSERYYQGYILSLQRTSRPKSTEVCNDPDQAVKVPGTESCSLLKGKGDRQPRPR